jgi:hypothetical protein
MGRKIEVELDGKEYKIEFDRDVFKKMDSIGVSITTALEKPLTFIEMSFKFGLRKHHSDLTQKKAEQLYNCWLDEYGFDGFGEFVVEEYNAFYSTTQPSSDKPKKSWKIIE